MYALSSCALLEKDLSKPLGEGENLACSWLQAILSIDRNDSSNQDVLTLLLHLNEQHPHLYEWTIRACYVEPSPLSARAFKALARLFSIRDFPCDPIELLVLCLTVSHDWDLEEAALLLLKITECQYLNIRSAETGEVEANRHNDFPTTSISACRYLSKNYPQLTLQIFSEISYRLESSQASRQSSMLGSLTVWFQNIGKSSIMSLPLTY